MKNERYAKNSINKNTGGLVMYVDMNSFFASCEQQLQPALRGKPVGVCPYESPNAAVIAVSLEAKTFGITTGMRLMECRELCPQLIIKPSQPVKYRQFHIIIINVLKRYCNDVIPKSIDEAILNFTSYKLVYKDFMAIARQIKNDIKKEADYLKCSIGIAPNAFLAKLATELQKPDGLVEITPRNIDEHLKKLNLTDLPGIANGYEKRLRAVSITTPIDMRYASISLLRKALGGIVGYYWHCRLNFLEVDLYVNQTKSMGAGRTVSAEQSSSLQTMDALIISLCTRLEQRMVKQSVFCRQANFSVGYKNRGDWKTLIQFSNPLQDAIELRSYIAQRIKEYEDASYYFILNKDVLRINITVYDFISAKFIQYNLFDNRIQRDALRRTMYVIKNKYGKNSVRKACETIEPDVMKDAIGFGSVKELNADDNGEGLNNFLLEE
ncbi:MAG: DNA polymerase IV [Bacteroidota bacterium]|nr:DNA polymerase IV [Bacteroidota bacterium]